MGLTYNFEDGDDLEDRLGNGDYELLKDIKKEDGVEALLNALKDVNFGVNQGGNFGGNQGVNFGRN